MRLNIFTNPIKSIMSRTITKADQCKGSLSILEESNEFARILKCDLHLNKVDYEDVKNDLDTWTLGGFKSVVHSTKITQGGYTISYGNMFKSYKFN